MEIEIGRLHEMHPRLPIDLAVTMVERAALALERNGHASGAGASWEWEHARFDGRLSWPGADMGSLEQHDYHRITEDGAEAVALVLAHRHQAWRVIRRLQREEHADWLLESRFEGRRDVVALEVSGVDRGNIRARVAAKLAQVAKSADVHEQWAGVVGFEEPTAILRSSRGGNRGT